MFPEAAPVPVRRVHAVLCPGQAPPSGPGQPEPGQQSPTPPAAGRAVRGAVPRVVPGEIHLNTAIQK